jgi:hypothetical protein
LIRKEQHMFCPNCKTEHKPGIQKCPDCGADLVDESKELKPTVEKERKWALLCTTHNLIYADFVKETLEKNEIPCLIKNEGGMMSYPPSYAKIYVPEEKCEERKKHKEQLVNGF